MKFGIRQKILLMILTASAILYIASIGYILSQSRKIMVEDALQAAKLVAEGSAQKVEQGLENDMLMVRTLANGLTIYRSLDTTVWQNMFSKIYEPIVLNNRHITTLWDSWEYYGYVPGYTKPYGRYCISVYRDNGVLKTEIGRRSENGDPDKYGAAKASNTEYVWEPYYDEVVAELSNTLMVTLSAPIQENGRFVGLVGVDVTLQAIQAIVSKIHPVEGSYAFLVSSGGVIAAHPDVTVVNKKLSDVFPAESKEHNLLDIVTRGEEYIYTKIDEVGNEHLNVYVPVKVGNAPTYWSLCYSVPMRVVVSKVDHSINVSVAAGLVGLLLLVVVVVFVANSLTKPITMITSSLKRLSRGEITDDLTYDLKTGDEIEEMSKALNVSIEGLNKKSVFATNIGNGNYGTELELLSESDELGKSLIGMQKSLIRAQEEEKNRLADENKRSWANEGVALFGSILHKNNNDPKALVDELLREFVRYLDVNQGAIYLLNEEEGSEPVLEMASAYAWDRRRLASDKIRIGEGLVGACFFENETIHLTKVPEEYIKITSGLGEASPTNVVIVPLKHEAGTMGVLELASFAEFEEYQIDFLEKVCQNVANTLSVVKINEKTRVLLQRSQEQAEQMQSQEEEMRQNMEELLATQEEMARKESEMSAKMQAISTVVLYMEYDFTGSILFVNEKMCQITGYSTDELVGKHHGVLFDNKHFAETDSYRNFWTMMRSGSHFEGTLKRTTKSGSVVNVKATSYPVFDEDGQPMKIIEVGIVVD